MSMEFLPRLFDSFSRERIPCEKQKKQATPYFDWCRLCAFSGAVGIVCPCMAVVHTISVGWYGLDGITGRCSG